MDFTEIIYTKQGPVATITLNRPHALNAFTPTMIDEWVTAIETAKHDDDVRVLVVTGNGRGFCTGIDLKTLVGWSDAAATDKRRAMWSIVQRIPRALATFDKLYVASINGPAHGAGMDACSMTDIRIASDQATFSINHIRIGGVSVDAGYFFLTRLLGIAKTIDLVMKYDTFSAEEALRIGFVNSVVPHEKLAEATQELAERLAAGPPIAMRLAKRLIYGAWDVSLDEHLNDVLEAMLTASSSEDFEEGTRAVLERRPGRFKGR